MNQLKMIMMHMCLNIDFAPSESYKHTSVALIV